MALGLASSIWYLVWVRTGGSGFLGITQLTFGIFGAAVSLVSMVVVSLITQEPDKATQKWLMKFVYQAVEPLLVNRTIKS
jgi:cation/acetate symporter